jgi:hypothetical protein
MSGETQERSAELLRRGGRSKVRPLQGKRNPRPTCKAGPWGTRRKAEEEPKKRPGGTQEHRLKPMLLEAGRGGYSGEEADSMAERRLA